MHRRKRHVQNGVNAIFSAKGPRERTFTSSESNRLDERITPYRGIVSTTSDQRVTVGRSRREVRRILEAVVLISLGISLIGGAFFVDSTSQRVPGSGGSSRGPPAKIASRVAPLFYAVANGPELIVPSSGSYIGSSGVNVGEFLVVQVAYSEGSYGNLPDIYGVTDSLSTVYSRSASASPGVGANFWEQVWTGRALSTAFSTNITVTPDWAGCLAPCVSSIIVSVTIARYENVAGVGASTIVAPDDSSMSQTAVIAPTRPGSMLVELLSHGAYDNCGMDAAQPGNDQVSRNCFAGTTERTELFDHSISNILSYTESYSWSRVEVQRGIYVELIPGN